jgi:flagellar protein FlaG
MVGGKRLPLTFFYLFLQEGVTMNINNITSSVGKLAQHAPVKDVENSRKDVVDEKLTTQAAIDLHISEEKTERVQDQGIEKALAEVNDFFQNEQRKLQFSVNDITGGVVIEVRDSDTDEVLRQIPPEFVVKLAEHLNEQNEAQSSIGVLFKEQA